MKPLISIVTPTYNHEKYIEDCIKSILKQTIQQWELIIIDDGSTDNTPTIVRRFDDSRMICCFEPHKGIQQLGENYNRALHLSRGEFIMILEGDDFIPPNRLEIQVSAFKDPQVVLSHGRYAYVFDQKMVIYPIPFKKDILNNQPIGTALKAFLLGINPIGAQSVMIRKSALLEIGGFVKPTYLPLVDYPTWMKLALKGPFHFVPEVLGYWRRHPSSITLTQEEEILNGYLKYCDEFIIAFNHQLKDLHLQKFTEHRGATAFISLAWIKITNKDWTGALNLLKECWRCRKTLDWSYKIKLLISFISVCFHLNLLRFFKQFKRRLYQQ